MMVHPMWTQGLSTTDKEEIERLFSLERDSKLYRRLKEVIETKDNSLATSERSLDTYDNPNWAYLQAHNNGARQMLSLMKKLFS